LVWTAAMFFDQKGDPFLWHDLGFSWCSWPLRVLRLAWWSAGQWDSNIARGHVDMSDADNCSKGTSGCWCYTSCGSI
jgi:hypothetical protein